MGLGRGLDRLRRPAADNTANSFMNQVVGSKKDVAAAGAVTETDTMMAYIKQIVTQSVAESDVEGKVDIIDAVLGALDDAAAAGAVTDADTVMAYVKQLVTAAIASALQISKLDGLTISTTPTAASLASFIASGGTTLGQQLPVSTSLIDLIGDYTGPHDGSAADDNIKAAIDLEATKTLKIDGVTLATAPVANSLAAYIASGGTALGQELPDSMSLVDIIGDFTGAHDGVAQDDNIKASLDLAHTAIDAVPKCIAKTDGAVLNGDDDLFTITGGPVRAKIVGIVTTIIGGAANGKLTLTTTTPAATVDLNAGAVAVDTDAAGTSYHNVGATSVFTPTTAGMVLLDPVTVEETEMILPIGTVKFNGSAAQDGVIAWYMTFEPLSPLSSVAVAA